jgi:hypothetical protein
MSGTNATYTFSVTSGTAPVVGQQVVISGMGSGVNNGTFTITAATSTTLTVTNASGTNASSQSGTGLVYLTKLTLTQAAISGSNTTYSYSASSGVAIAAGMRVNVSGFTNSGNNGTFYITSLGSGTFTVVNASGVNETHAGTAYTDFLPNTGDVITADLQYHFPVRFDLDELQVQKETPKSAGILYTASGIKLIEVRIPVGQAS